jgi:ribokinase
VRTAVVGHVEWVEFARVDRVPAAGDIAHATETWEEPAGGGAVAAVQLAKLAGDCTLFTALGDDEHGRRSREELAELGVRVEAATRSEPTRRALTFVDPQGERTITTLGDRLAPRGDDALAWDELSETGAVYFTAGDHAALSHARRARVLVATARELRTLRGSGIELDALVGSGRDEHERYEPGSLDPPPRLVVTTAGARGGAWTGAEGRTGSYAAAPLPGPVGDAYGAGDSFAAGLTFALGEGRGVEQALELAARCGAACMTGRGPYDGQLVLAAPR